MYAKAARIHVSPPFASPLGFSAFRSANLSPQPVVAARPAARQPARSSVRPPPPHRPAARRAGRGSLSRPSRSKIFATRSYFLSTYDLNSGLTLLPICMCMCIKIIVVACAYIIYIVAHTRTQVQALACTMVLPQDNVREGERERIIRLSACV